MEPLWLQAQLLTCSTLTCMQARLVAQLCPTLCDPMDGSPPHSSVYGNLRARILEWAAFPSSRGIFLTQGQSPHFLGLLYCRRVLYGWATREARSTDIRPHRTQHSGLGWHEPQTHRWVCAKPAPTLQQYHPEPPGCPSLLSLPWWQLLSVPHSCAQCDVGKIAGTQALANLPFSPSPTLRPITGPWLPGGGGMTALDKPFRS